MTVGGSPAGRTLEGACFCRTVRDGRLVHVVVRDGRFVHVVVRDGHVVVRDGRFVHVAMGTLTDAPTIRPTMHIFVGSTAPWFTISDDLPQREKHAA